MSLDSAKPQRTPEEKAARAARKAAKLAQASISTAARELPIHAESSLQAINKLSPEPSKKRRRASDATKQAEHEAKIKAQEDDPNLLEINVAAPEPLSKAELRAAKKRAKKGISDPDPPQTSDTAGVKKDEEDSDRPAKRAREKVRDPEPRRQHSIWIGNLSFKCTEVALRNFFEKGIEESGGDKEGCVTRIKLPKKEGHGTFAQNKG